MTRTRLIGWSALALCVLGYLGFGLALLLIKMGHVAMTPGLVAAGLAAVIGEIGLWVAAACLGFAMFRKRKAFLQRVFGRKTAAPTDV